MKYQIIYAERRRKVKVGLTAEQIQGIWDGNSWISWVQFGEAVTKAQLKNVGKWGEEECPHATGGSPKRSECFVCWESLLKEANPTYLEKETKDYGFPADASQRIM